MHTPTHTCCKGELERYSLTYASSFIEDVGEKWGKLGIGINEPFCGGWPAPKTYSVILGLQSTPFRARCLFTHMEISSFFKVVIYFPQSLSIPLLKLKSLFIHLTTHRAKLFEIVYLQKVIRDVRERITRVCVLTGRKFQTCRDIPSFNASFSFTPLFSFHLNF